MQSHTLWSEVLEIVHDARRVEADLLLTLGAGSFPDGAKVVVFIISPPPPPPQAFCAPVSN